MESNGWDVLEFMRSTDSHAAGVAFVEMGSTYWLFSGHGMRHPKVPGPAIAKMHFKRRLKIGYLKSGFSNEFAFKRDFFKSIHAHFAFEKKGLQMDFRDSKACFGGVGLQV